MPELFVPTRVPQGGDVLPRRKAPARLRQVKRLKLLG